jgi:hypothetical protein
MFEFESCKRVGPDVIKKLFLQKDDSSKSQPAGATRKRADKVGAQQGQGYRATQGHLHGHGGGNRHA